jgi:hypothetical protein
MYAYIMIRGGRIVFDTQMWHTIEISSVQHNRQSSSSDGRVSTTKNAHEGCSPPGCLGRRHTTKIPTRAILWQRRRRMRAFWWLIYGHSLRLRRGGIIARRNGEHGGCHGCVPRMCVMVVVWAGLTVTSEQIPHDQQPRKRALSTPIL